MPLSCPSFRAKDPAEVARRLLARDGIKYLVRVGSRDVFRFSLAYRRWSHRRRSRF